MEVDLNSLDMGSRAICAFIGVVGGILGIKGWHAFKQRVKIEPDPLNVSTTKRPKYVTVDEFNRHMDDNRRDHENLFARMTSTERETSKQTGLLESILSDLQLIKGKLFGGKKQ